MPGGSSGGRGGQRGGLRGGLNTGGGRGVRTSVGTLRIGGAGRGNRR